MIRHAFMYVCQKQETQEKEKLLKKEAYYFALVKWYYVFRHSKMSPIPPVPLSVPIWVCPLALNILAIHLLVGKNQGTAASLWRAFFFFTLVCSEYLVIFTEYDLLPAVHEQFSLVILLDLELVGRKEIHTKSETVSAFIMSLFLWLSIIVSTPLRNSHRKVDGRFTRHGLFPYVIRSISPQRMWCNPQKTIFRIRCITRMSWESLGTKLPAVMSYASQPIGGCWLHQSIFSTLQMIYIKAHRLHVDHTRTFRCGKQPNYQKQCNLIIQHAQQILRTEEEERRWQRWTSQ